jgi:hypothetical protein
MYYSFVKSSLKFPVLFLRSMWCLSDHEIALVLALVRRSVAVDPKSRTWVGQHVQVRSRKRLIGWTGTLPVPTTFTYVDSYRRWNPGNKKLLHSLALVCKQELLFEVPK